MLDKEFANLFLTVVLLCSYIPERPSLHHEKFPSFMVLTNEDSKSMVDHLMHFTPNQLPCAVEVLTRT